MARRIAALVLWSYFAWYLASMVASVIGGPPVAGPVAALLTASIGAVGWLRRSHVLGATVERADLLPTR